MPFAAAMYSISVAAENALAPQPVKELWYKEKLADGPVRRH
jgi:hypothetical protein